MGFPTRQVKLAGGGEVTVESKPVTALEVDDVYLSGLEGHQSMIKVNRVEIRRGLYYLTTTVLPDGLPSEAKKGMQRSSRVLFPVIKKVS